MDKCLGVWFLCFKDRVSNINLAFNSLYWIVGRSTTICIWWNQSLKMDWELPHWGARHWCVGWEANFVGVLSHKSIYCESYRIFLVEDLSLVNSYNLNSCCRKLWYYSRAPWSTPLLLHHVKKSCDDHSDVQRLGASMTTVINQKSPHRPISQRLYSYSFLAKNYEVFLMLYVLYLFR